VLTYVIWMLTRGTVLHILCHVIKEEWANKGLQYAKGKDARANQIGSAVINKIRWNLVMQKPSCRQIKNYLDVEVCAADNDREATTIQYSLYDL
jgi:hypothetical protein